MKAVTSTVVEMWEKKGKGPIPVCVELIVVDSCQCIRPASMPCPVFFANVTKYASYRSRIRFSSADSSNFVNICVLIDLQTFSL